MLHGNYPLAINDKQKEENRDEESSNHYKDAGVDIDAGYKAVSLLSLI